MVFYRKRKATSRNAPNKRRRTMPPRRKVNMPLYTMRSRKTTYLGTFQFVSTVISGYWRYFEAQAVQLPEFAQFKEVFDEYKITNIKYTFRPRYDGHDANSSTAGQISSYPLSYSHIIKDPASTKIPAGAYSMATVNEFLENGSVKTYTNNRPFSVSFKPKVLTAVFGGSTGAQAVNAGWIRTSEETVSHRGFHMFLQNNALLATNPSLILDTFITFTIQFRGAR